MRLVTSSSSWSQLNAAPRRATLQPQRARRYQLLAAAATVLMIATGCSSNDTANEASTRSKASDNGETSTERRTLTVYSGRSEELVAELLEDFTKATGVEVEFRPGDSGELSAQILTEGENSPADVFFSQDAGALGALSKAKLLKELPEDLLQKVDPRFRAKDGTWVGTSGRARVLIIDPRQVPEAPTSIDDLLEPEWKGKIGFAPTNASFQSFVTGLRVVRGEEKALQWLKAFADNDPVAFEKNGAVRDAVNDGQVAIGLINHYYLFEAIAERGKEAVSAQNVFLGAGDPGGLINVAGVGLLKNSARSDAAMEFVEFLLSDAAQKYFAAETFEYPLIEGVSQAEGLPSLDSLDPPDVDLSDLDSIGETQELLAEAGLLTQ